MRKALRLHSFDLCRAQRGWVCDMTVYLTTSRQFTDEMHTVRGGGRWWITAYWSAKRAAKALAREIGAKPGERERLGWAASLLALLGLCCTVAVAGQPCATPVVYQPAYVAPVYATPILPAVFVPVPSYTVGLSFPDTRLDEILQRLDSIEATRPAALQQSETAEAVLTSACLRCHAPGSAEAKGGGIVFEPSSLSLEQRRKVLDVVLSGTMPKGGPPLSGAKRAAVLSGLVQ